MGQVLIRNIDDETVAAYKEAAAAHGRSLEAELRDLLLRFRPLVGARREQAEQRLAAIRAMTRPVRQTPGEDVVRAARDGDRGA
ncbi:hypothetical protein GCM10011380_24120 [Sphingomonas metalli]|uniref:Antitoxin FitA-like ribbon-helix-helix domain-containing protein n=1 Tax=Sphingomonas metalli TaxID=1779358 RepID=A0A916T6R9_9SPHN|nr:hypothetical protein [Sphingomonas metalli]GGB33821.1 hypothetical protein GCM10011380_24120 [Sphingomonas metalli]